MLFFLLVPLYILFCAVFIIIIPISYFVPSTRQYFSYLIGAFLGQLAGFFLSIIVYIAISLFVLPSLIGQNPEHMLLNPSLVSHIFLLALGPIIFPVLGISSGAVFGVFFVKRMKLKKTAT